MVQFLSVDAAFTALADPTRRAILERLGRDGAVSVSVLAEPFSMTLTGMKKHISVLEQAGLVTTQKVGRTRMCRVGPKTLDDVESWISTYRSSLLGRMDRFAAVLEREQEQRS